MKSTVEMFEVEMIKSLIREYKNPRNDGYITAGMKLKLEFIKELIEDALK